MTASHVTTSLCVAPHTVYIRTYRHPHHRRPTPLPLSLPQKPYTGKARFFPSFSERERKETKMAKIFWVLFVVCILPAIVSARFVGEPFLLKGSVYCDTCNCGYETDATKYMPGATVRVECRDKDTAQLTYTKEAVTDSNGQYTVLVESDRGDDVCDAVLVKSAHPECSNPNKGRDRARVILTRNNGMISNTRYANAMGFLTNTPLANCAQILQKYQEAED